MTNELPNGWDRQFCRQVINRLRDGLPPPAEAMDFLSIGAEPYLERARQGMRHVAAGEFDSTLLIGRYGVGKSHLLRHVQVLAEAEGFNTRLVEIGSGTYFNKPEEIAQRIAGDDYRPPDQGTFYFDSTFVQELNSIALRAIREAGRKLGLVILIDEVENTFEPSNLPRFSSRIRAYRYLNTLFCGYSENPHYRQWLKHIYVMIAITPGILEQAMREPPGRYVKDKFIPNPATEWSNGGLPDQFEIEPLTLFQGLDLAKRVRAVHGKALDWNPELYLDSKQMIEIAVSWQLQGINRDERQLVKSIIETLEVTEQEREL